MNWVRALPEDAGTFSVDAEAIEMTAIRRQITESFILVWREGGRGGGKGENYVG